MKDEDKVVVAKENVRCMDRSHRDTVKMAMRGPGLLVQRQKLRMMCAIFGSNLETGFSH